MVGPFRGHFATTIGSILSPHMGLCRILQMMGFYGYSPLPELQSHPYTIVAPVFSTTTPFVASTMATPMFVASTSTTSLTITLDKLVRPMAPHPS